ncbi:hypothetical protein Btru_012523 [Bulinus truncatus]|nr:hypothetical protein Btru_012523 [Bulinus truncatus]
MLLYKVDRPYITLWTSSVTLTTYYPTATLTECAWRCLVKVSTCRAIGFERNKTICTLGSYINLICRCNTGGHVRCRCNTGGHVRCRCNTGGHVRCRCNTGGHVRCRWNTGGHVRCRWNTGGHVRCRWNTGGHVRCRWNTGGHVRCRWNTGGHVRCRCEGTMIQIVSRSPSLDLYLSSKFSLCNSTPGFNVQTFGNVSACLFWSNTTRNFTDAMKDCKARGSIVATFKTWAKFQILRQKAMYNVYIGLDDMEVEGVFRWHDDGSVLDSAYSKQIFKPGQPDNYQQMDDCVIFGTSGLLSDVFCIIAYSYVCEKNDWTGVSRQESQDRSHKTNLKRNFLTPLRESNHDGNGDIDIKNGLAILATTPSPPHQGRGDFVIWLTQNSCPYYRRTRAQLRSPA